MSNALATSRLVSSANACSVLASSEAVGESPSRRTCSIERVEHVAAVLEPVERQVRGGSDRLRTRKSGLFGSDSTTNGLCARPEVGGVVEEVVGAAAQVRHGDVGRHAGPVRAAELRRRRAEGRPPLDAGSRGR